jgi:hypothetical protein
MAEKGKKATLTESQIRTEVIVDLLLQCYTRSEIIEYCRSEYDIGIKQVDVYLHKAREIIAEQGNHAKPYWRAFHESQYIRALKLSFEKKDTRTIAVLLRDFSHMCGLIQEKADTEINILTQDGALEKLQQAIEYAGAKGDIAGNLLDSAAGTTNGSV